MERIKVSHFIYLILGVTLLILAISAYKVEKNHEEKLYRVLNSKMKETALECYLDNVCNGRITLNDLYEKKYLETLYDPVTKEKIDHNICLEYKNERVEFC